MAQAYSWDLPGIEPWPRSVGRGTAFGTFGELLQGRLVESDLDFLVTFPIARYAHALFIPDSERPTVEVSPGFKHKSQRLAAMMMEYYGLPAGGRLIVQSDIPVGKGLASSSADLVATARSIASCFAVDIPPEMLQRCMRDIEPSDGVMYPGVVSFYHREVKLREHLGALPPLTVVSIDEGGEVDTIRFNRRDKPFTDADKREYHHLLESISAAIRRRDVKTIGRVATRSAVLNQKLNPKQTLAEVLAICREIYGLGVAIAHSGTCLGIILSPQSRGYLEHLHVAEERLRGVTGNVTVYHSLVQEEERMRNVALRHH